MSKQIELSDIVDTIKNVTGDVVDISVDTHLIEDDIVDSLDSAVFLLEIEKVSGKKLSDKDIDEKDLFKVVNLITHLNS